MMYRTFGRMGTPVAEVGFGTWGMGGWSGSNDEASRASLTRGLELGCNFLDTALAYGDGYSERLIGGVLRGWTGPRPFIATKLPPKNGRWPARADYALADVFPADYIRSATEQSLENLGVDSVDLQQFHVWTDAWATDDRWQRAVADLKAQKLVRGVGISINRWQPKNAIQALRTGLIDAVQVVYNIFDQAPEDELFPVCQELGVAVIARVPFDEGSLTGTMTVHDTWPQGDWRNIYFTPQNLRATLARVERVRDDVPRGMDLPELALRFILHHPAVTTVIPGMRTERHVERNLAASDGRPFPAGLLTAMRAHRWDRTTVIP
ncbi:MAG: aldo/keto reductase [Acidobacteria bacterium]|nr:aldo/keto reductase [Acidobacteriota bacterium]